MNPVVASPRFTTMDVAGGWQNIITFDHVQYQYSEEPVLIANGSDLGCSGPGRQGACFGPCIFVSAEDVPKPSDETLKPLGEMLKHTISTWMNIDDVLATAFAKHIILPTDFSHEIDGENGASIISSSDRSHPFIQCLEIFGTERISTIPVPGIPGNLRSGPYLWTPEGLHKVYRLYEDSQEAFFSAIIQEGHGEAFQEQRPASYIPVPSRLYSPKPSEELPLSGLRFGSKDVFDIAGLKTSAGSRSYYSMYPNREKTAPAVQILLSLGAVLVGKTKNTQFANGEDPQEWIDYSCPWNPRGDGYQNPDTSSSGSASAVASYDWLDFAIGSDTCGSISCPAGAQGLFSLRFSTGMLPQEGVFTVSKHLDSLGFFCRDVENLELIGSTWLSKAQEKRGVTISSPVAPEPDKIVYPWSSFPHDNPYVSEAVDAFLRELEESTGLERQVLDIEEEWEESNPSMAGVSMPEYFKRTTANFHLAGFRDNVMPFFKDYQKKFDRAPYLDKVNAERSKLAKNVTGEDRKAMLSEQDKLAKFFSSRILGGTNSSSLGGIMIWPFSPQEPQYRDTYPSLSPHVNWRWDIDFAGPLAGLPTMIIPIGQFKYFSRITQNPESLPNTVAIVAPPKSDIALLKFINTFLHSKIKLPRSVKTGRLAF